MIEEDDQDSQNNLLRPPNDSQQCIKTPIINENVNSPSKISKKNDQESHLAEPSKINSSVKSSKINNSPTNPGKSSKTFPISTEKGKNEVLTQIKDASKLKPLSHKGYNPINDAIFEKGDPVPFSFLVGGFEDVSKCKGENSKEFQKNILANIFKSIILLRPDYLSMTYFLCILKLTPDYIPSELGIGNEILTKSISKISGRSEKQIRDSFNKVIF